MEVVHNMDPMDWLRKHLDADGSDLMKEMVRTFAQALMSAEADARCGAPYREVSIDRVNSRNGCRARDFDTRVRSIDLAIPKLRSGSYFPDWLLEPRRRAERALTQVMAECLEQVPGLAHGKGPGHRGRRLPHQVPRLGPYTYVWPPGNPSPFNFMLLPLSRTQAFASGEPLVRDRSKVDKLTEWQPQCCCICYSSTRGGAAGRTSDPSNGCLTLVDRARPLAGGHSLTALSRVPLTNNRPDRYSAPAGSGTERPGRSAELRSAPY